MSIFSFVPRPTYIILRACAIVLFHLKVGIRNKTIMSRVYVGRSGYKTNSMMIKLTPAVESEAYSVQYLFV